MGKNNHKRLVAESRMTDVINYMGYRTTTKNRSIFLFCPEHELKYKGDNTKSQENCETREGWNNCHCYVCKRSYSTKEYLELWEGISFGEAYDLLYEIMGKPEYYKGQDSPYSEEMRRKNNELSSRDALLNLKHIGLETQLTKKEKEKIRKDRLEVFNSRNAYLEKVLQTKLFVEEKKKSGL